MVWYQLVEAFGAGTAAIVSPVDHIAYMDDDIRIPDSTDFDAIGNGDYAIELWFKSDETIRGDLFVYKGAGGDLGIISNVAGTTSSVTLFHNTIVAQQPANVLVGTWHHVVVSRSAGIATQRSTPAE